MNLSPLILLLLAPLAAIVFILATKAPARPTAGIAAAFNLILSLGLLINYPAAQGTYAYVMDWPWFSMQGLPPIHFHFGVDGISLPLVFLTAIVTFAAIAVSPGSIRRASEYYCYLLLMSLGAMGAFISLDLFFFYIFHEFALIPTFLLIGIWGSQNRQFAAFQVTLYLMTGSLILLAGLVGLVMALPAADRTFDMVYFTGGINSPMVWNRALSPADIASITANPWQIYATPAFNRLLHSAGGVVQDPSGVASDCGTMCIAVP